MKPVNKFFYYMAWMGIIGAIAIIVVLTYWFVAPYEVVTFGADNTKLIENTVKSGGYLQIKQDYNKKIALPALVSCEFIDGITYFVPPYYSNRVVGQSKPNQIEYKYVPKALPAGVFRMRCVYSYKVNPLRTIEYTLETDFFTIIK